MGGWGGRADWGGSNWGESGEMGEFGPVPPGEHCANAADWDGGAADAEQKLLEVLNFARERGEPCESNTGEAAPPLAMRAELRCAARLHSLDMVERDFFDHTNPDGTGPEERIRETGYSFRVASESICCEISESSGMDPYDMAPYDALAELFDAGGNDCKNLVDPWFDAVGIGYFGGYWTLDFAGP
jgi:uncharacterized protein YkwD